MKLSEAIRLGSMMKAQAFGVGYNHYEETTCALGAAWDAIGQLHLSDLSKAPDEFLFAYAPLVTRLSCPECHREGVRLIVDMIIHLNDIHRWTRERIADFIETLELAEQPAHPAATLSDAVASPVVLGK